MEFIDFLNVFPTGIADGLKFALLAIGVYLTYRILDFPDLTVDGTLALGGAITATLIVNGVHPILAMLIALVGGMIAGLCTALLHTKLNIPPILASILVMLSLYSVNIRIMNGSALVSILKFDNIIIYTQKLMPFLNKIYATIVVGILITIIFIAILYWFMGTELGSSIRATGNNGLMAKAQGINTDNTKILCLMISNGLVALCGAFITQATGNANVDMGRGAIVIGLASCIIGEMIFKKRIPFYLKLLSVVIGAIVYRTIIAIAILLGLEPSDLKLISSIIVVIALAIPFVANKIKERNRRKNANKKREAENASAQ